MGHKAVGTANLAAVDQFPQHSFCGYVKELDDFVPRGVSSQQLYRVAGTIQPIAQQSDQGFVRCGVHGGCCDLDAEFRTQRFADFARGSAGLELDGKCYSVGLDGQERRQLRLAHVTQCFEARTAMAVRHVDRLDRDDFRSCILKQLD